MNSANIGFDKNPDFLDWDSEASSIVTPRSINWTISFSDDCRSDRHPKSATQFYQLEVCVSYVGFSYSFHSEAALANLVSSEPKNTIFAAYWKYSNQLKKYINKIIIVILKPVIRRDGWWRSSGNCYQRNNRNSIPLTAANTVKAHTNGTLYEISGATGWRNGKTFWCQVICQTRTAHACSTCSRFFV